MFNDRDSYTDFNPNKKYSVLFPYVIGTVLELKSDSDVLAKILQYRVIVKDYKEIINVGLTTDFYSYNPEVMYEITVEELEDKWKVTDKIVGRIDKLHLGLDIPYEKLLYSKDSEHIVYLLDTFKYIPSRTEEILNKYNKLLNKDKDEPVRRLKL